MEFGSDFHHITLDKQTNMSLIRPSTILLADGRMALQHLIKNHSWKRIWVPQYFCYDVIDAIGDADIKIDFYHDFPGVDDDDIVSRIKYSSGDVLLRMNYFGLRSPRDNSSLPIEVIEDHSHGINTPWAIESNADFCISSLRKSIPVPEGGIIWSPLCRELPIQLESNDINDALTLKRHYAMYKKTMYLKGYDKCKDEFRRMFIETEDAFCGLELCGMSKLNETLVKNFDSFEFDKRKKKNWIKLSELLDSHIKYLTPEEEECIPFSMILKFESFEQRERARKNLINNRVFPAILWNIPTEQWIEEMPILLSIHCDGRYNLNEIKLLANIINHAL